MIKKILLIFVFSLIILSCGKKTDPEYQAKKDSILISKI